MTFFWGPDRFVLTDGAKQRTAENITYHQASTGRGLCVKDPFFRTRMLVEMETGVRPLSRDGNIADAARLYV